MTGKLATHRVSILIPNPTLTSACRDEIMRSITVDGNFTADHIKQKRGLDDVWLTNGEGMMTARGRYHAHLAMAVDTKDVSSPSDLILPEIHICA